MDSCELCKAERKTKWFHEDDLCWVAYCSSCSNKIIIVLKRHTPIPTDQEKEGLYRIARWLFNYDKLWRGPRKIPEHYHLHEI